MDHFLSLFLFLILLISSGSAIDKLGPNQSLTEGETLVSEEAIFELGFFTPDSSTNNRFLGIWYKKIPDRTVVWVANRDDPIPTNSSGTLTLAASGNLVLLSNTTLIWSTNTTSRNQATTLTLRLLRSGNLVLEDETGSSRGSLLWQSFDYPTNTFLPEMKIGWDLRTGLNRRLVAWTSPTDPSSSDFSWGIEKHPYPESVAWMGDEIYFRSGPWNGLRYSGAPEQKPNSLFWFRFESDQDEVYYTYGLQNRSVLTRNVLNRTSYAWERSTWNDAARKWIYYSSVPKDKCDRYDVCGPHGNCNIDNLLCQCLQGFNPKSLEKWNSMDWTQGCEREKPLECGDKDGFKKFSNIKLPDTTNTWVNATLSIRDCKEKCLNNCSCTAYTYSDIRGLGSGCALWFGDLRDIRTISDGGQDLYIRMAASALGENGDRTKIAVVAVVTVFGAVLMVLSVCYIHRSRTKFKEKTEEKGKDEQKKLEKSGEDMELPVFDLAAIINATENFSLKNKLGEGGFGPVYKGKLEDGQEIAVKRLSSTSGQGLKEFKNEVILIAKLQHRNLVKLLGCCIEGDEKMLVYEYMANKSLDAFIFDEKRGHLLDWPTRFDIVSGVARGLLYLHQDSRLRIIHRDLKASNVLLDKEMNPKISDFGMARTFGGDQTEGNTNRVVGTYGYMAPEYAIDGLFSVKSDVFSFGILVLEIISGKRSRGVFRSNKNLIGHAWRLYTEGTPLELMDPSLESSPEVVSEVMRCIQVSFLCLQHRPEDRPSMAAVAVMLGSDGPLPPPKQPGFLIDSSDGPSEGDSSSSKLESSHTVNEITISLIKGR